MWLAWWGGGAGWIRDMCRVRISLWMAASAFGLRHIWPLMQTTKLFQTQYPPSVITIGNCQFMALIQKSLFRKGFLQYLDNPRHNRYPQAETTLSNT